MELEKHIAADKLRAQISMLTEAVTDCAKVKEGKLLPVRPGTDGMMKYININVPAEAAERVKSVLDAMQAEAQSEYESL